MPLWLEIGLGIAGGVLALYVLWFLLVVIALGFFVSASQKDVRKEIAAERKRRNDDHRRMR